MITDMATVKILGGLYTIAGSGAPDESTEGSVGDIWLDTDSDSESYGNSYLLTGITEGEESDTYNWERDTTDERRIELYIKRAEQDYLRIRNRAFEVDDAGQTVYPDGSDIVAAEMACFLMGIYDGRGEDSGSIGDRSSTYEKKLHGYLYSIVGQIERFIGVGL